MCCSIGVLIVTYNRPEKLKQALLSYSKQTCKPKLVMVVDNNSKKDTSDLLKIWKSKDEGFYKQVYTLKENFGGSGGFYYGFKKMLEADIDWIWVADDDAYPDENCFNTIKDYIKISDIKKISAVCSSVLYSGSVDTWHRRRTKRRFGVIMEERIPAAEYNKEFEIDFLSYVGSMIKKEALIKAGNVRKDFFIAYDDSEHSIRLKKTGEIICIPAAKVIHDTDDAEIKINIEACNDKVSWKKFYTIRNKLYSYRLHYGRLQAWLYEGYYLIKNYRNLLLYKMTVRAILMSRKKQLGLDSIYNPSWDGK